MMRRRLVVPAIVVLAVAADITVRLTDRAPEVPPAVSTPAASAPPSAASPPPSSPSFSPPASTRPATVTGRTPGTITPPDRGQAPPVSKGTTSLDGLLETGDVAPAGVAEQLEFFNGGGGEVTDCWDVKLGDPLSVAVTSHRAITQVPAICVRGFGPTAGPVVLTVTRPDGTVLTASRSSGGEDTVRLPLPPGSPTGRYRIHAEQDGHTAATTFVAFRPARPTMWVEPRFADPGDPVSVYLGGFPAGRPADVHLYQCAGMQAAYRTTLRVPVDAAGQAQVTLTTTTFSDTTCYIVVNPLVYDPLTQSPKDLPPHLSFVLRQ